MILALAWQPNLIKSKQIYINKCYFKYIQYKTEILKVEVQRG